MRDKAFLRAWVAGLAVVFVVAACGSPIGLAHATPPAASAAASVPAGSSSSPAASSSALSSAAPGSPNPADQAIYAKIETQVQALRQLKATRTVTPVLLDSAGVASYITKLNETGTNHAAMANQSRLFIDMGMLPPGSDLEQMELALQAGQVVGFYDTKSKGLYVLSQSGGVGASQKVTFAHEYTHALQDQNFNIDKVGTDAPDQGDRDLGRLSLLEGDATLSMTQWATRNMTPAELLSMLNEPGAAQQLQQLNSAPAILRQDLSFPYEQGLAFVQRIYKSGGWSAVDKVYANPPASTSQILHPDLYTQGVMPVDLKVPDKAPLPDWKLTMQDTLGEWQLGIWLGGSSGSNATSSAAVNQWAGDRVALYEGPNGAWVVVLRTAWRTTDGGQAFDTATGKRLSQMNVPSRTCNEAVGTGYAAAETVVLASDQSLIPTFASCAG